MTTLPPRTPATAIALLSACRTADEVAQLMRQFGAKGWMNCPYSCVIANFFVASSARKVTVDGDCVWIGDRPHILSEAAEEFVERFDDGRYPDLVE